MFKHAPIHMRMRVRFQQLMAATLYALQVKACESVSRVKLHQSALDAAELVLDSMS